MRTQRTTEEKHLGAHLKHLQHRLMTTESRVASEVELKDIEIMLSQQGVKPVSDSVNTWGEKQTAKKGGGGLWSIVTSFRADRRAKDAGDNVKKAVVAAKDARKINSPTLALQLNLRRLY